MALEIDLRAKVFWRLFLFREVFIDQRGAHGEAGSGFGRADVFEHHFIGVQGKTPFSPHSKD